MKDNYIVYMHTNKINNKKYIGLTRLEAKERWRSGKGYKTQKHFNRAIQKYGWDNFEHSILFSGLDAETAEKIERELIKKYKTMNPKLGYNKTSGGECKKTVSAETIEKMRIANTGKNNPRYGKKATRETRKKMSESRKGEKNPRYGIVLSDEVKEKISQSLTGIKEPEETCRKKSESAFNRKTIKKVINLTTNEVFKSAREAANHINVSYSCIRDCCNGKQKTSGGFRWAYYE